MLEAMEDILSGLQRSLDGRVYVAVGRGLWDFTSKEIYDYVDSLQEGKENKVRQHGGLHQSRAGEAGLASSHVVQQCASLSTMCITEVGQQIWSTEAERCRMSMCCVSSYVLRHTGDQICAAAGACRV